MSHSKVKNYLYRGMLWLVLMALVVSPAAAEVPGALQTEVDLAAGPMIYLAVEPFDPLLRQPDLPEALVNDDTKAAVDGAYLVQFTGPVLMEWVQALEALGAQVGPYIPDYAFIVRLDAASKPRVESLSFVRWVGPFEPAYRVSPRAAGLERNSFRVVLLPWADVQAVSRGLEAFAQDLPGAARVQQYAADGLSVVLDSAGVLQAARLPGVLWVEPIVLNELYNDVAGGIMNAPTAWDLDLDGSGVTIGAADTGLDVTHGDFDGRVVQTKSYPVVLASYGSCVVANANDDDGVGDLVSGHGTHVTGSIAGSGFRSAGVFKGMAHDASITFQAVEQYTTFTPEVACAPNNGYYLSGIPTDVGVLLDDAHAMGARVHNNSWGSPAAGTYTVDAANFDERIHQYQDLLVTVAAGNYGADGNLDGFADLKSIATLGAAKNVLTVGASDSLQIGTMGYAEYMWGILLPKSFTKSPTSVDYTSDNPQELAAFSSRGPAADGRIKPDVVAPGTNILSTRTQQDYDPDDEISPSGWGTYNDYYMYFGGTSMASPLTAGAAALVREYYIEKLGVANPSAALIKATLINTAVDITGYGYTGYEAALPIPNPHEGWGRINVGEAVTVGAGQFVDNWSGISTGAIAMWNIEVVANTKPFKITLVWSDEAGTPNTGTTKVLVNNLDLEVISPGGTIYRGNYFSGGWSLAGGSADQINNVENVYIQTPAPGNWLVRVKGTNVPEGPQPYALVMDQQEPRVTSFSPAIGLTETELIGALVQGNWLQDATGVKLVKGADTIDGTIQVPGELQISVNFDLADTTPGVYDLVVVTPRGTASLPKVFTLLDASLPDLKVTLATVKNTFLESEPIIFTLQLENDSLIPASGVTFTQTFPEGVSLLAVEPLLVVLEGNSLQEVTPDCAPLTPLADGYRCTVGDLPGGAVFTYTVTAIAAKEVTGVLTSTVSLSSTEVDRWAADNANQVWFAQDFFLLFLPMAVK